MKRTTLLAALALSLSMSCTAQQPTAGSEALAAAIRNLDASPSVETRDALYQALNHATYLVPLLDEAAGNGTGHRPVVITSPNGEKLQAIFSSHEELALAGLQNGTVIEMHAAELWKLVKANQYIDGAVLNPARNAIPLKKARIDRISTYR
jgi:hypothetical protein